MRVPVLLVGHYSAAALWAAVIAVLGLDAAAGSPALSTALKAVMVASLLAWTIADACDSRYHQQQLCERCAAASPLGDPQAAASRWRLVLRAYHSRAVAVTVRSVAPAAAVLWLALRASGIRTEGTPLGYAGSTAILVLAGPPPSPSGSTAGCTRGAPSATGTTTASMRSRPTSPPPQRPCSGGTTSASPGIST